MSVNRIPAVFPGNPKAFMQSRTSSSAFRDVRTMTTLVGVAMALLMGALENTIVGTAMPTVAANLGGLELYSWVFTAYILASTVTTPIWGKLADLFGRRAAMFGGLALFILGSAAAGAAQTMPQLVGFRVLQGLGASALFPVGMTIVADLLTLEQRAKVVGLFSGMWGVASLVGPTVGGYLTGYTSLSWRACFYIIIPAGLLSAAMIALSYTEETEEREEFSFDYLGAVVLSAALILLLITVENSAQSSWTTVAASVTACCALFWWFVRIERSHPEPLVPLELFENRLVLIATVHGLFAMMALIGTMSFLPLFVQAVLGTGAIEAGNILMPLILAWVLTSIIAGRLILRAGYQPLVIAGMGALLVGSLLLVMVSETTTRSMLSLYVALMGVGGGLVIVTMMIAAQHGVSRDLLGVATSTVQFARNIGAAIGTAGMGAIMKYRLQSHLENTPVELPQFRGANDLALIVQPEMRAGLSQIASTFLRTALADALHGAFVLVFIVVVIAALIALFVPRGFAHELVYQEPPDDSPKDDETEEV
jgi:EmrB/QacA subfamily drug resistance transporter